MDNNIVKVIRFILVLIAFAAGYFCRPIPQIEKEVVRDTVTVTKIVPYKVRDVGYITGSIPRAVFSPNDTIEIVTIDSVQVEVPIREIEYKNDLYRAVISGPIIGNRGPSLDHMEVYRTTQYVTQSVPQKIGFGLFAGPAISGKGFSTVVGVGIYVNLFNLPL